MPPKAMALNSEKLNINTDITATTDEATIKPAKVRVIVLFQDDLSMDIESVVPPSKRITTRAMEVNTGPKLPKLLGETIPSTGPMIIPISINNKTSGTIFLSYKDENRWAKNTSNPMATNAKGIDKSIINFILTRRKGRIFS